MVFTLYGSHLVQVLNSIHVCVHALKLGKVLHVFMGYRILSIAGSVVGVGVRHIPIL